MSQEQDLGVAAPADGEASEASPLTLGIDLLAPFLALVPDAAVVVDTTGVIVAANEQALSLFGYCDEELIGRPLEMLVPERFRHNHREHRARYAKAPRARAMGATLDLWGRRSDAGEFPVDISLAPIDTGNSSLVVAAIRDATERHAATAAAAQLAAIVQSSLDAMVSVTLEGLITTWNPGAETLFGYSSDDAVGRHISFLVPEEASVELEDLLATALAGTTTAPRDSRWVRRDGSRVDVALSVSPLCDSTDRTFGFSALLRDVTERKQSEAEVQRVLTKERRGRQQQSATSDIRLAMLSGTPLQEVLRRVCRVGCELLDAQTALIATGSTAGVDVVAAWGAGADVVRATVPTDESLIARTVTTGQTQVIADPAREPDLFAGESLPTGPALGLPITSGRGSLGALVVARDEGEAPFEGEEVTVAAGLADQAALALELGRAQEDSDQLLLANDRERIAHDLHDLVIQRLFGAGMALQNLVRLTDDSRVADRIGQTVDDLDMTIREIRSTIFALQPPPNAASGLRSELLDVAHRAAESLGFEPTVRFDGPVDAVVPDDVMPHVVAVAHEGLSNVARHAHATRVEFELSALDDLVLVIVDDGVGIGQRTRDSGLANLRDRAAALGGTLELSDAPAGGTRLEWRVPLKGRPR